MLHYHANPDRSAGGRACTSTSSGGACVGKNSCHVEEEKSMVLVITSFGLWIVVQTPTFVLLLLSILLSAVVANEL